MSRARRGDATLSLHRGQKPTEGWLVVNANSPSEQRVPIRSEPVIIGSREGATIVLADPHVSGAHAQVVRTAEGCTITDLDSRNGTQVDGVRVQSALLQPGASIVVGTTFLRFQTNTQPIPSSSEAPPRPEGFASVIGDSPRMREVLVLLDRIGPTNLSVCVMGETGTGKDVIARAIHANSPRRDHPFVVIDCGAVAANLIESHLFGHHRGAFTGAVSEHPGAFEQAHGGTIFLDEIGELALDLQPKLLRILETGSVMRVGGTSASQVDVRVIAATNRDLEREVRAGRFREDLWFRLSTAVVTLPPLRERRQDIPALIERFVGEVRPGLRISRDAMDILMNHDWPGNVRELKNVLSGAAAMCEGSELSPRDFIMFSGRRRQATVDGLPLAGKSLEDVERAAIRQSLQHFSDNKTRAAEALGIAPSTLYAKIKKYGL